MVPGSRVLVVDDDRDTVLTCCILLQREGYEVQGVHTPQDALYAVEEFRPEVVILDISMPGNNGGNWPRPYVALVRAPY